MKKRKVTFWIIFILVFLVAPIYVTSYTTDIELAITSSWKFFGGLMLLYYAFYNLFGQFVAPSGYPSYFGELHFFANLFFLIFIALLASRVLTMLFTRAIQQNEQSIFWSMSYFKRMIKQVVMALILGFALFFLGSFVLSSSGLINWLYNHTDVRSDLEVTFPIALLGSCIFLIVSSYRSDLAITKFQKLLLFVESIVFTLGFINLLIGFTMVLLYSLFG